MNVLITGANGFSGKNLSEYLKSKGYNIIRLTRKEADLQNFQEVKEFASKIQEQINTVIHTAFKTASPNQTKEQQIQTFNENILITKNTIELASMLHIEKFINFSSMSVYPSTDGCFNENSIIKTSENTDCMYGLAKFCAENMFDLYLKNTKIIHLRIAQIFSENMREDRIIPVMKRELSENNKITVYGNGERSSCFISVLKLCEIINFFLQKNLTGIYNTGEFNITYYDLAKKIINKYGNENSEIIKEEKGSKSKFRMDFSKLAFEMDK